MPVMPVEFEYSVKDNLDNVLGVFDDLENAVIFLRGLFQTYFLDESLKFTLVRQAKLEEE